LIECAQVRLSADQTRQFPRTHMPKFWVAGRSSSTRPPRYIYPTGFLHRVFRPRQSLHCGASSALKTRMRMCSKADMFATPAEWRMLQTDAQERILEAWFRLPESRRRYATDAVAFAFRVLREDPGLLSDLKDSDHERIVSWLLPHI
jgi:hypothetical protein